MDILLQRKIPGIQLIFYNLPLISHSPTMYLRASFLEGHSFLANGSFGMIFSTKLQSYYLPLSISNLVLFPLQIGEWNLRSLLSHLALSWGPLHSVSQLLSLKRHQCLCLSTSRVNMSSSPKSLTLPYMNLDLNMLATQ